LVLLVSMIAVGSVGRASAQSAQPVAQHKNWIHRHPVATGFIAGVATHHALKVSAARKKRNHQKLNWAERHPTLSAIGVGGVTTHVLKKQNQHHP